MKKFTKFLVCLMLCVFGLGLVACDNRTAKEKAFTYPKSGDQIQGNGGLAVKKGKYVYFVNGYKAVSDMTNKNKNDKYTVGSLMLMKLGENGEVVTDENGLVKDDYYITMSKKLCGYEATDLFIHGSYLYFVSPILENETGDKNWAKERVVFYRIKLDKTSKVEEVYRSNVKMDSLEFKYYENGYVLAWEKGKAYYDGSKQDALVRINLSKKKATTISQKVSSVVFADELSDVFYVKNTDDGYDIKRYNVDEPIVTNVQNKPTVKFIAEGKLYLTQSHELDTNYTDLVVLNYAENESNFRMFYSNVGDYEISVTPALESEEVAVVLTKANTINLIETNQVLGDDGAVVSATIEESENVTDIDIIDFTNSSILYHAKTSDSSLIKLVSYTNALDEKVEITELTSTDLIESDYVYFDLNEEENCLYFYQIAGKNGSNYYLHRLKVNNNLGESEEMFGVYDSDDEPEVEEPEEEVEEE